MKNKRAIWDFWYNLHRWTLTIVDEQSWYDFGLSSSEEQLEDMLKQHCE